MRLVAVAVAVAAAAADERSTGTSNPPPGDTGLERTPDLTLLPLAERSPGRERKIISCPLEASK